MKTKTAFLIISSFLWGIGFLLLYGNIEDKVIIGILFFIWANNIQTSIKNES